MTRTYWLDVFTVETWHEFRQHGGNVSGFPKARVKTVKRMQEGDYLLCYVKGTKRWVGVLEVAGPAFEDESRIWAADTYPARIPVRIVIALDPEYGVPITDLQDQLSIFAASKGGGWGVQLQGAPRVWTEADGDAVVHALQRASEERTYQPLPGRIGRVRRPRQELDAQAPEGSGPADQPDDASNGAELITIPSPADTEDGASDIEVRKHSEIQFKLVKLGSDMGFDTHVARNDRKIRWNGMGLEDIDGLRDELNLPFDRKVNDTIELIDVLWLDGGQIVAAFEIESTTSIYSGLLRMSDMLAMNPNMEIHLYLVAPEARREKVKEQINRPTFAKLRKPLVKICRYVAFERLIAELKEHERVIRHMKIDWLEDDISESCAKRDH